MKKKLFIFVVISFLLIPFGVNAGVKKVIDKEYQTKNFIETLEDEELEKQFTNYQESSDKIMIYLFRGKGCGYCRAFLTYLNSITEEYGKYFNMTSFEVWYDEENWHLFNQISYLLDNEPSQGVPYIVIGDKVIRGYAESFNEEIKSAITDLYNTPQAERYDVFMDAEKKGLISIEELEKLFPTDSGEDTSDDYGTTGSTNESKSDSSCSIFTFNLWNLVYAVVGTASVIFFINYKFNQLNGEKTEKKEEKKEKKEKKIKKKNK